PRWVQEPDLGASARQPAVTRYSRGRARFQSPGCNDCVPQPESLRDTSRFCKPVGNHIRGTVPPPMPAAGTCRLSPCSSHQGKALLCRPGPSAPSPVTDIDECLDLASCPASATCTNTPGNHFCTCNTGFASSSGEQRFTQPAAKCNDIDECSRDPSPCGPSSVCTNTLGSYACTCLPGYLPPSQPGIPFSCT
ncbi:unnamed protein product, partial [Eretmochelys imbricata]